MTTAYTVQPGTGEVRWGSFEVRSLSRPADAHALGGDRAGLRLDQALVFHLVDAAGHGARGAEAWAPCADVFRSAWEDLQPGEPGLRALADQLNRTLYDSPGSACLVAGDLSPAGTLRYTSLGWGTHALVVTEDGPWRPPQPVGSCGLKLGWMPASAWSKEPRSFVLHEVERVRRVVLISDGLLEDDHRDPEATWAHLAVLCAGVARASADEVIPWLLEQDPRNGDDLTLVQVDRTGPG